MTANAAIGREHTARLARRTESLASFLSIVVVVVAVLGVLAGIGVMLANKNSGGVAAGIGIIVAALVTAAIYLMFTSYIQMRASALRDEVE